MPGWGPYYGGWGGSSWGGWGSWGGGWAPYWRPSDPVGSGCYHPETLIRYRSGETAYCSKGGKLYCDWGSWRGSCGDF